MHAHIYQFPRNKLKLYTLHSKRYIISLKAIRGLFLKTESSKRYLLSVLIFALCLLL